MMHERLSRDASSRLAVELDHGHAEAMGDGMFIVFQTVDEATHSIVLSRDDLVRLIGFG